MTYRQCCCCFEYDFLGGIIVNNDVFSVSIKGILYHEGKYLLRKNQRNEYELIGGRLDINDNCPEERLKKEFLEEAGANVNVLSLRNPWLYIISQKNIIIVPYLCELVSIDEEHEDLDGGIIKWIPVEELNTIFIPYGYVDSIRNELPRTSFSKTEGEFFRIIPNYRESDYSVEICVYSIDGRVLMQKSLSHYCSPIDVIQNFFNEKFAGNFYPLSVNRVNSCVKIEYVKLKER